MALDFEIVPISKCTAAKGPATCRYHSKVIGYYAALRRIQDGDESAGWDLYEAMTALEAVHRKASKGSEEIDEMFADYQADTTPVPEPQPAAQPAPRQRKKPVRHRNTTEPAPVRAQQVAASLRGRVNPAYPERTVLNTAKFGSVNLVRADRVSGESPKGVVLVASREVSSGERGALLNGLRYALRVATKKPVPEDSLDLYAGGRSVGILVDVNDLPDSGVGRYSRENALRLFMHEVHSTLEEGSAVRKDGTSKLAPIPENLNVIAYYIV